MSWIAAAIFGGGVVGGILSSKGASKQAKALGQASDAQARVQQNMLDFQKQIYEEAAGFRRIAEEEAGFDFEQKQIQSDLRKSLLPKLLENLEADPADSPAFQRTLEKGTENIRSLYDPLGLTAESGPTSVATGEFAGSLYGNVFNQTLDRNVNTLLSLYGGKFPGSGAGQQGAQATSTAAGLYGPISNVSGNIANLTTAKGAVQGNLYGSIGQDVSNLGLLYGLGAFK